MRESGSRHDLKSLLGVSRPGSSRLDIKSAATGGNSVANRQSRADDGVWTQTNRDQTNRSNRSRTRTISPAVQIRVPSAQQEPIYQIKQKPTDSPFNSVIDSIKQVVPTIFSAFAQTIENNQTQHGNQPSQRTNFQKATSPASVDQSNNMGLDFRTLGHNPERESIR